MRPLQRGSSYSEVIRLGLSPGILQLLQSDAPPIHPPLRESRARVRERVGGWCGASRRTGICGQETGSPLRGRPSSGRTSK